MWDLPRLTSHGGLSSVRRIFTYALAALIAALLWTILAGHQAFAADATWNDDATLQYDGKSLKGPKTSTGTNPNLPSDTVYYEYIAPAGFSGKSTTSIVYFDNDQAPTAATSAKAITYTVDSSGTYSNPSTAKNISLTPSVTSSGTNSSSGSSGSSCDIDGVGWIVCPLSNFLASGMDNVFDMIKGFMEVKLLVNDTNGSMQKAWSYMLNIANTAFVIAFLIIIYSQLTSVGLTNYSIKKLLPRLIITAILVNISYYLCAVAIDASNILGDSLQKIFIAMRQDLAGPNTNDMSSWTSITSFILAGGTASAAGGVAILMGIAQVGGSLGAALILLLPLLLAALLAVLVALVVLAARQAVITVLVIIAPLAFVAYLLPNTEKWFEKWRSTFLTLLLFFPIISVIFGGSQLASMLIMQNTDNLSVVLLAMFVQVAPLVLTPILLKFSGNIVGKIAGMVNNPSKGLVDRSRNWAKERSGQMAKKKLADQSPIKKRQVFRRYAVGADQRRRNREQDVKNYEAAADNRYQASSDYAKRHEIAHNLETDKKLTEAILDERIHAKVLVDPELLKKEMSLRVTTDEGSLRKAKLDKMHEELRAGYDTSNNGYGGVLTDLTRRSETVTRDLALTAIANQTAKRAQQSQLADALIANEHQIDGQAVREYAAGIDTKNGQAAALANAVSQKEKEEDTIIDNQALLIKQFKLNGAQRQELVKGKAVPGTYDIDGKTYTYTFEPSDANVRAAALDLQTSTGAMNDILYIMENSGSGKPLYEYRKMISEAIPKKGLADKASYLSGVMIDKVLRGEVTGKDTFKKLIVETYVEGGKYKEDQLAKNDKDAIVLLREAIASAPDTPKLREQRPKLKASIEAILTNPELRRHTTAASRTEFESLKNIL